MRNTPYYPLGGGLDVVTPVQQMRDGLMIAGDNFEPWINGGYRRIRGYERFDGRPAPSAATWVVLNVASAAGLSVGDTVTGDASGATATVVLIDANAVVVTKVTGTFVAETLNTSSYTVLTVEPNGGADAVKELDYRLAAQEEYRQDIQQVPGVGPVRGIWQIRDREYAFRDNAGVTACVPHKATSSGWSSAAITFVHTLRFDGGQTEINVGNTLTGATSSASGTVHKVVVHRGSWGTNDAIGYVALTGVSGAFTDNENLQVSAANVAVASGASQLYSLPAGGRYEFVSENYLASSATYRVYGANGMGPAFEIDENDILTPILLDLTLGDAPEENNPYLVESFDGALWLMFPGGSVQKSITGDPLTFNGFLGAAEFGLGEEGTGLINSSGRVLIAYTRRQTFGFFPLDAGGYQKRLLTDRVGAILYSTQEIDTALGVDDSGLVDTRRAEVFGDFANATVSGPVQPILFRNRDRIIGSHLVKETNQYRVLFSNGIGVIARKRANGKWEFATYNYQLPTGATLFCCYNAEDENTEPRYFFGGSDGFVYQAEIGQSFDGREIESFLRLPFNHQGTPARLKRYRLALVDVSSEERIVTLQMSQDRDFGDQDLGTSNWNEDVDSTFAGGGVFDLDNWDEVFWDSQLYDQARFELLGSGKNVSLLFYHRDNKTAPFVLEGVTLHYDNRRVTR